MPRVDFYVLADADGDSRLRLACRLAEKAFAPDQRVFVLAASTDEARQLDELLWTFRDRSFVPHALVDAPDAHLMPVLIGTDPAVIGEADVLINLAPGVPPGYERFGRIVEPLDGNPERRQQGRERFRYYRERGDAPQSHDVGANHEP
jgi:DNA polymerase-3 subunit chi